MFQVRDLMTTPVFSLKETDSLFRARNLMDLQRIRHIPILTADNRFAGLVTHRDILAATISRLAELGPETQKELDEGIPIREIMRVGITTVTASTTLGEAATILLRHKYGCLPVVEDERLVGILTEADFLRLTISLLQAVDAR